MPIGAGVFGRVLSPAASGPLADPDFDGLPDPLDIDDDGDLVLDNVDPSAASRALRSASANQFHLASSLALPIHDTVNANSPAFTDEQIEAALLSFGVIIVQILPGAAAELDCGGLLYCSLGGTGRYPTNLNPPEGPPFPGDFDADNDGFGRLTLTPGARGSMFLLHGARAREPDLDPTTSQIGTGDMLFEHVTTSGDESQCPQPVQVPECASFLSTLQFTFATVPALVSFSDETGETMVPYPIAGPYSGPPEGFRPSGPGTHNNGFPVTDGPDDDQDVELTFTFWRPQRRPIPDELCPPPPDRPCTANEWIDIGGLTYSPVVQHLGSPGAPGGMEVAQGCPESTLSSTDPRLSETSPEAGAPGGFTDQALDQPASDTNTFTYTLNLTQCLASLGISSWDPGQELDLTFAAKDDSFDTTDQGVTFKRQP